MYTTRVQPLFCTLFFVSVETVSLTFLSWCCRHCIFRFPSHFWAFLVQIYAKRKKIVMEFARAKLTVAKSSNYRLLDPRQTARGHVAFQVFDSRFERRSPGRFLLVIYLKLCCLECYFLPRTNAEIG